MEYLLRAPFIQKLKTGVLQFALGSGEFGHISMDATIRLLRRVRGQADYLDSAIARANVPIPDDASKRRILTLMGRAGATLGLPVVKDESSEAIAQALVDTWPIEHRMQVKTVRSDNPGVLLERTLRSVLPSLQFLAKDAISPTPQSCTNMRITGRLLAVLCSSK